MDKTFFNISNIGNFTKIAVRRFENNIVNKNNYLEEVKKNRLNEKYKFKEKENEY